MNIHYSNSDYLDSVNSDSGKKEWSVPPRWQKINSISGN